MFREFAVDAHSKFYVSVAILLLVGCTTLLESSQHKVGIHLPRIVSSGSTSQRFLNDFSQLSSSARLRLRGGAAKGESSSELGTSSYVSSDDSDDQDVAGANTQEAEEAVDLEELTQDIQYLNTDDKYKIPEELLAARKQEEEKRRRKQEGEEEESDEEESAQVDEALLARIEAAKQDRLQRKEDAKQARSKDRLRSPILCVLGHVDTGKTKLLDKVRKTNVQEGEAGGITQQIGATFFPMTNLRKLTDQVSHSVKVDYKIPGLLVIDTPGHESFSNLRSRGTSICDICVLVVDIMHGLEPQTIESLQLLKRRRCPFLVALNKIDRCYDWQPNKDSPIQDTLAKQKSHTVREFESRWQGIKGEIASQGLNADLYYENKNPRKVVSVVPTSAITGEGVPDLLLLGIQLTQKMLVDRLMLSEALEATVLEVKVTEGFGTTLDIILVHGELHEGDTIVVCGMQGPIVTTIRTLLTPHPMKELRVKNEYVHHKSIEAAMGVKIAASGLEGAVAGTSLLRLEKEDDIEELKSSVMEDLEELKKDVDKSGKGVHVQASTLGALEALLDFLHNSSIPVASINIGPVHKKDVIRASAMLERAPDLAMILAFDVKIVPEAEALAKKAGIKIFTANIIYHLFDQFKSFMEEKKAAKREQLYSNGVAVFPVILSIIPKNVFNKRNPIILGCEVKEGSLKVGTPLCIPELNFLEIGKVTSIQNNHKEVKVAKVGMSVAVKIEPSNDQQSHILYGRQFDHKVKLYSKITRDGIQAMKDHFAEEMTSEDWKLMSKLKQLFIRGVQHW